MKKSFYISLLIFVAIISFIAYVAVKQNRTENKVKVSEIVISGDDLISKNDYLQFTKLKIDSSYSEEIIRSRLAKHPYIDSLYFKYEGKKLLVTIVEKKLKANITSDSGSYILSENFQLLPIFKFKANIELPVINSYKIRLSSLDYVKTESLISAFKLIDAAQIIDLKLYKSMSEINLADTNNLVLNFIGANAPVYFGKGDEVKKMVHFFDFWTKTEEGFQLLSKSKFIDLRYENEIFITNNEELEII